MNRNLILIIFFIGTSLPLCAQKHTVNGIVKDASSGETLIGVNIHISGSRSGVVSNNYGYFSLTLPKGNYALAFSYIGYKRDTITADLSTDLTLTIDLHQNASQLEELVISSSKLNDEASTISTHRISMKEVKALPAIMGEPDLLKTLQLLPGVQTTNEGTTNLSIRGGSHDQNLYLVDGAPVYNPNHALNLISTFNADAIKSVDIYKGTFPAQYGGRLSSVVDVRMKDGNSKHFKMYGNVGLATAGLTLEGPLKKDKASLLVSGRYSYIGALANGAGHILNNFPTNSTIKFYDFNIKATNHINDKNKIYLSFYSGRDRFAFQLLGNGNSLQWGNNALTFRWNHIYGKKLFSNYKLTFSDYRYANSILDDQRNFDWKSNMSEVGNYLNFDWYPTTNNTIKFGVGSIYHTYAPGILEKRDITSVIKNINLGRQQAIENVLYISSDQRIGNKIKLNAGLRYSNFYKLGKGKSYEYDASNTIPTDTLYYKSGEVMQFYDAFEPRISFEYSFTKSSKLSLAYANTVQYLHLISNSSVGIPTDVWLPSGKHLRPIKAKQLVGGFATHVNKLGISVEVYYREMNNVLDYINNADLFINDQIETQIVSGKRKAHGVELKIDKRVGRLTGWVSYTYASVLQKIDEISDDWYHTTYDKPHNLSIVGIYPLNKYWKLSAIFKYTSGGYTTIPQEVFYIQGIPFVEYTSRNDFEKPTYHRLDISFTYARGLKKNKKVKGEWTFSIYNLYNRKNAFAILADYNSIYELEPKKLSLYGVAPSINYRISF